MKMTITPEEVAFLNGKFIIQLDTEDENRDFHKTITEKNWEFLEEKRISFVCGLTLNGFYYKHNEFATKEEFAEYWNNYHPKHIGKRYHRLLTAKELDFVLAKMKQKNF